MEPAAQMGGVAKKKNVIDDDRTGFDSLTMRANYQGDSWEEADWDIRPASQPASWYLGKTHEEVDRQRRQFKSVAQD